MPDSVTRVSNSHVRDNLYERDYYTWSIDQARALQERRVDALDWENLADEVGDLGRNVARSVKSQLARLLTHLLKWRFEAERRKHSETTAKSWRISIGNARDEVLDLLQENPGLKPQVPELFARAYRRALNRAQRETGLGSSMFPASCPWTFEQAMDEDFWPEAKIGSRRKRANGNRSN
jgi:hypothetical protein